MTDTVPQEPVNAALVERLRTEIANLRQMLNAKVEKLELKPGGFLVIENNSFSRPSLFQTLADLMREHAKDCTLIIKKPGTTCEPMEYPIAKALLNNAGWFKKEDQGVEAGTAGGDTATTENPA